MDAARDTFAARGCAVLVVSQAKPEVLALYLSRVAWRVQLASDPERTVYAAFGLGRTGWPTFFRPHVLWGYLRKVLIGYGLKRPYPAKACSSSAATSSFHAACT